MWLRRHETNGSAEVREMLADAEQLLNGHISDSYAVRTRRLRPWMVLNLLAHSDRANLELLRDKQTSANPAGLNATVTFLAGEILSLAADDADLTRIPREHLLPLELELLGHQISAPETPAQLAELVMTACI